MAKFDSYPDNSAPADADLLISTDVSDTSADATGTTKKLTVSTLLNSGLDATVAALTATGVTDLSSALPDLRFDESDQASGSRVTRMFSQGGLWFLAVTADNGSVTQEVMRVDRAGAATFNATSVSVPTPTAAGQAVKVVAWDDTTGRYAVQGPNGVLEQGDTGWRDVSADLINGWTGTLHMRRVGYQTWYRTGYGNGLDGSSATATYFYSPPTGFRWDSSFASEMAIQLYRGNGAATITGYCNVSLGVGGAGDIGGVEDKYSFFQNLLITETRAGDAWPSSLPGTAV